MKKKLFAFVLLAAMTVQCTAFAGTFSRGAEEGNANKISYVNYLKPGGKFEYKKMSGQPAVADTDILGKWTLRSWANARIVCYEFTKDNYWIAYSPQWVGPDPKPKNDENGVLKTVAAGHYKIQHEGNYNPVFKLYEANGKFYAYVSIDQDDRWKVLSINGEKTWFYKEN
jgi:hypothetical protein